MIIALVWCNILQAQSSSNDKTLGNSSSEVEIETKKFEQYNQALINYNKAVRSYNAFINFRNKRFKPERTDADIQKMIDNGLKSSANAFAQLNQIEKPEGQLKSDAQVLHKDIKEIEKKLKEQQTWLKNYFSKTPMERTTMLMNLGGGIIMR